MSKVIRTMDLAKRYDFDRSALTKKLKRNGIDVTKMFDPSISQYVSVISVDDAEKADALFVPEHEIVNPDDVLGKFPEEP